MSTGPLDGYRVIELGQGISAAFAAMQLGDGGADVVKVEPKEGDIARTIPPFHPTGDSAVFTSINRNKRAIALDLQRPEALDVLGKLIAGADVLIEDVDFTREQGLAVSSLAGDASLVHCRISGFGPKGPWSELPGGEIAAQMASEAVLSLGALDEPPVRIGTDVAATYAGIYGAQGILAALFRRHRDGEGQTIDVSLFGCMLMMRATLWAALTNPDDWSNFHNDSYVKPADHGYQAKDGALMLVVGRLSDEQWSALLADLGLDTLLSAKEQHLLRTQGGVNARLAHVTKPLWERGLANFTVEEAAAIFNKHGGNAYRINDYPHLFAHPQTQHLQLVQEVAGANGVVPVQRPPWQFSEDPVSVRMPPPALGQHTDEVLVSLGYSGEAITALRSAGVLGE